MPISEEQAIQFDIYFSEYVKLVKTWKEEWLKESPPTDLVIHLNNPHENTKKRKEEWSRYVTHRTEAWWKERGWKIIWGLTPNDGCHYEPISETDNEKTCI